MIEMDSNHILLHAIIMNDHFPRVYTDLNEASKTGITI